MDQNNSVTLREWSADELDTIRKTVAIGASEAELKMFARISAQYQLDPFNHEIWFVQMGRQNTIITARDGYLKIANNNPHFSGIDSDVVYSGDKFFKDKEGIHHSYDIANRGQIIGAYALVFRDDRSVPAYFFAPFKDYNRGAGVWKQYPHAMILKVAEAMALKRAFAINGLVTQEELGFEGNRKIRMPLSPQERKNIIAQLWTRYKVVCDNIPHAQNAMRKVTGKISSKDFTDDDIYKLQEDIIKRENEKNSDAIEAAFVEDNELFEQKDFNSQEVSL